MARDGRRVVSPRLLPIPSRLSPSSRSRPPSVAQAGHQIAEFADEVAALIQQFPGRVADAQQLFLTDAAGGALVIRHQQIAAQIGGFQGKGGGLGGVRGQAIGAAGGVRLQEAAIAIQGVAAIGELEAIERLWFWRRFRAGFRRGGRIFGIGLARLLCGSGGGRATTTTATAGQKAGGQ
jgi:hypothetical protein